ncbi:MAG: LysR family transcriptional regulator [Niameybacter sp.]|uniref:LysR family transcriptional regulator n=1 Tax=Niameybacter sp. TaxID=2033640 RepID=UPI002FCBFAC4
MLEELKTFVAVVEYKNFTKASERVNLSQPSVSVHIKNLERHFDTQLIIRSVKQKNITITEKGHLLYRRAKEMIVLLETTEKEMHHLSSTIKGMLKIGATYTIGECILPHFLKQFCEQYPDIEIEVVIDNTARVRQKVQALQLDIGLIEGLGYMGDFEQVYFLEDELVIMTPKEAAIGQQPFDKESLQHQRWVTREEGSGLREYLDMFLAHNQIIPQTKLVLGSNYAIKESVKNGLGIAMVSEYIAKEAACMEEVNVIKIDEAYKRSFSYILPRELATSKVTQVFREALDEFNA